MMMEAAMHQTLHLYLVDHLGQRIHGCVPMPGYRSW